MRKPGREEEERSRQQDCRYKGPVVSPSGWSTEGTSPVGTMCGLHSSAKELGLHLLRVLSWKVAESVW